MTEIVGCIRMYEWIYDWMPLVLGLQGGSSSGPGGSGCRGVSVTYEVY